MNGEDIFKSIVSGEDQSILGDVARAGYHFLVRGIKKLLLCVTQSLMQIKVL